VPRALVQLTEVPVHRPWLTERFLRRLVGERRCAFHRIGRRVYFDLKDLDDLAERGRVEPPPSQRLRAVGGGP
jgi:hypothetical protein